MLLAVPVRVKPVMRNWPSGEPGRMPERVAIGEVGVRAPSETSRVSSRDWLSGDSQPERTGMANSIQSVGSWGCVRQASGSTRRWTVSNQQVTLDDVDLCIAVTV